MQILRFYLTPFYLFMIFQNLIYGLFISGIQDQFFFFSKFKLGFKKKGGQVHGDGVQICIIGGLKHFF